MAKTRTEEEARFLKERGEKLRRQREARGFSQARIAELVGTTQQTIDRLERGETEHSRVLTNLNNFFGDRARPTAFAGAVLPIDGVMFDGKRFTKAELPKQVDGFFPIYSMRAAGEKSSLGHLPMGYMSIPAPLAETSNGYGLLIRGDGAAPALRGGDLALVDPTTDPEVNNEVVLQGAGERPRFVTVGTLIGFDNQAWRLKSWNPQSETAFKVSDWPTCHLIVGKFSRI